MSRKPKRYENRDIFVYSAEWEAQNDADLMNSVLKSFRYKPGQLQIEAETWWVVEVSDAETGKLLGYL